MTPFEFPIWLSGVLLATAGGLTVVLARRQPRVGTALRAHAALIAGGLALLTCALLGASAYLFRPTAQSIVHYRPTAAPESYYDPAAPWLLAAGAVALLAALAISPRAQSLPRPAGSALLPAGRWRALLPLIAGALALAVLAEANGGLLGIPALRGLSHHLQFALLAGGIALVTWGLAGARLPHRPAAIPWGEIARVGLLTLAALIVRLWMLGSSVRVMVDEGHFAFGVAYFWRIPDVKLLEPMPTSASFPFLFAYWQSWAVDLFGRNFFGLRAASALLGALTIPALYLLARALFDRTTAVIAALFLLTFPPHLHFSRLALNNIADPLFGTAALAFLARGLRTQRRADYALGGALLGLTQYFYEGGRLLFPVLAAGWLLAGLIVWRPRPSARGVLIAALAFALVAAPVYTTLVGLGQPLLNRMDNTALNHDYWTRDREPDTVGTRLTHFKHSLMMYVNAPENTFVYYYLYYGGHHPLILEYLVPLFFLGLILLVGRWRAPALLLVLWVIGTSAGNALLVESAVSPRYVVVFPALALLMAAGLRFTLPLLWPDRLPAHWLPRLLIAAALGISAVQLVFYFGPFLDLFNVEVREHVSYDAEDALLRAADFPPGTSVHLIADKILPQVESQRLAGFLADDLSVDVLLPGVINPDALRALPRGVDQAFFFGRDDVQTLHSLFAAFGERPLRASPYGDVPREKELLLYYLPAVQE